ncbi:hypothetical protein [Nocardia sp. NPDC004260]
MYGIDLREIAQRRGPFVSLCVDASHNTEDAEQQKALRWRSIREQLAAQDVPEKALTLLDDTISKVRAEQGRAGRVLIADSDSVLVDHMLAEPPAREIAGGHIAAGWLDRARRRCCRTPGRGRHTFAPPLARRYPATATGENPMERGNSKHGPVHDDELAHELEGTIRGNRSSRAEEWREPEPPADDDTLINEQVQRTEHP